MLRNIQGHTTYGWEVQKSNLDFSDTRSEIYHVTLSSLQTSKLPPVGCLLGARHFTCIISFSPISFHVLMSKLPGQEVAEVSAIARTFLCVQRSQSWLWLCTIFR